MKKRRPGPTKGIILMFYFIRFKSCYVIVSRTRLFNSIIIIEMTIDAKIAVPNPSITKEGPIKAWAIISVIALITNKNNPSVISVIGNVKKIKIGFTMALMIDSIKLAKSAVPNPSK